MNKQAFGRACVSLLSVLLLGAFLAGCDNDDATRSPDLPPGDVSAVRISCTDTLSVGETDQCTSECDFRNVTKDGNVVTTTGRCPAGGWRTDDCDALSIDGSGNITGIEPGLCNVRRAVDGVVSDNEPVTVVGVTANCSIIYVAGAETAPVPNADCSNNNADRTITVPIGTQTALRAAVRLSDGNLCYAPDAPAGQTSCAAGTVNFFTSNATVASFANSSNGIVSANAEGMANLTATASVNQVIMTVEELTLETGTDALCVEPLQPAFGCQEYSANTIVCETTTPPNIPIGGTQQFRARAFFDVSDGDPDTGFVCDVTNSENTTWSIADVGTNTADPANPTVNDAGLVSGGGFATTEATVMATFDLDNDAGTEDDRASGTHDFNVLDDLALGGNSVIATVSTLDPMDPVAVRAACVGSYDLVAGLAAPEELPAERGFFAATRKCPISALDSNNNCDEAQFDNSTFDDVTNAEDGNQADEADGTITWSLEPGYWDGTQCVLSTDPAGEGDNLNAVLLGDDDAGARYTDGAVFSGMGDARVFASGSMEDNGQAESLGPLRLATNCITATYNGTNTSNGESAESTDGITLIVLPVTNDSLLTDPDAEGAVSLCNTLVPLFNLGAGPDGANGAVVQAVSAVSALLNPLTSQPDLNDGLDTAVTEIITQLNPITGALSDAALTMILTAANDGVYAPLNCAIQEILEGIATQDPSQANVDACAPGGGGGGGGGPTGTPLDDIIGLLTGGGGGAPELCAPDEIPGIGGECLPAP